jgi:AcrR family transcriptional regulator
MRPDDRRAAIVRAAATVFARHGYDQASMREVANAAGITTPVLYDHFTSKAQLYATLVDACADDLLASWSAPVEGGPEELFRHSIDAIFAWIERDEAGWRLLFLDNPGDPEVAAALRRKQELATAQLVGLFQRVPELALSTELARDRADALLAESSKWAVNAIAAWWWSNRDLTRDQIVALTTDLLWHGIQGITTTEQAEQAEQGEPR